MSASGRLVEYGETWWGSRWVDALEEAGESWAERLPRGDEDFRRGRVGGLDVGPGDIKATVRGETRSHPVQIRVPVFDDETWDAIVDRLAEELRFTARLVAGELPRDVEPVVEQVGRSLFPSADELDASCDCSDDIDPCRHVAAAHFAFAGELDRDPFLLMRLRGRDRGTLLAELRARRSGARAAEQTEDETELAPIGPEHFYEAGHDLDAIGLHPSKTDEPGAVIDRIGPPPGVKDPEPLVRLIENAVTTAWKVAAGEGADVADDETLLAELRARGVAKAQDVADGLGWPLDRTRQALDRLWEDGDVLRTGSGEGARYRAS